MELHSKTIADFVLPTFTIEEFRPVQVIFADEFIQFVMRFIEANPNDFQSFRMMVFVKSSLIFWESSQHRGRTRSPKKSE